MLKMRIIAHFIYDASKDVIFIPICPLLDRRDRENHRFDVTACFGTLNGSVRNGDRRRRNEIRDISETRGSSSR